jgi:hypothetical protein
MCNPEERSFVCTEQISGEGVAALELPTFGEAARASAFTWQPSGETVQAQAFRFQPLNAATDRVLATAGDRQPIALLAKRGKGRLITVGIPLGLGVMIAPCRCSGNCSDISCRASRRCARLATWSGS